IQPGLVPVQLYNQVEVDPLRDDLAVKLVELRSSLKTQNPQLAGGLKVAANSAAFGLLCQMNVKDLDLPSPLRVFSGEASYTTPPSKVWEQPAEFYCPVIASLVTGGSHLLCAMLERAVRDMGGQIAAMDTDSAMIVSTKDGGLIPCAGGPHTLEIYQVPSGHAAIRALSSDEVDRIPEQFRTPEPVAAYAQGSVSQAGKRELRLRWRAPSTVCVLCFIEVVLSVKPGRRQAADPQALRPRPGILTAAL